MWIRPLLVSTFICLVLGSPAPAASDDASAACARVAALGLPATTIEARPVAAGTFQGPPAPFSQVDVSALYRSLPPFCRVSAIAAPTADSHIAIEVWLPVAAWNGRLLGLGNGGFAGLIDFQNMSKALARGYAVTATDAGHTGSPIDASWAPGHPEKVVDFGHRGIHEMTRVAKAVVQAFYRRPARKTYFDGCSDGGREALMEAQRYPDDYDGILAGAPAYNWTALLSTAVFDTRALTADPASFIPPAKIATIAAAVNARCDALDGVKDGVLSDPRQCTFDPASIACRDADADSCLTTAQVKALETIYRGPHDARGAAVYPGYPPGAEAGDGGWTTWITGPEPKKSLMAFFGLGYFTHMVYGNQAWDDKTFQFDVAYRDAVEKTATVLDATNPDLSAFTARGGKLILYHGWQDPAIPAASTIQYVDAVTARLGRTQADASVRFYLAPGVLHCSGGPGPDAFGGTGDWSSDEPTHSLRAALLEWVERNEAPATVIATKFEGEGSARRATSTRPLCPYPLQARYNGTGDTQAAASFSCAAADR